jgi:carbamoyltransferase
MYILGINGGFRQGYQDVSACIIKNGEIIAAIEEERLNRIKFSPGKLPESSIREVLKIAKIEFSEIHEIAFHGESWDNEIQPRLENYFINHFGSCPAVIRYHHHDCHAASSYYASTFDKAIVITFDNSGDGISVQVMLGENGNLNLISRFERPNSLGLFYQIFTQICGFQKDNEEYKLMGLASYGDRTKYNFDWLIDFNNGELKLNQDYIQKLVPGASSLHKDEMVYNEILIQKIGIKKRLSTQSFEKEYKDLAASVQYHLEKIVLKMIDYYAIKLDCSVFCFAGGVALNCVMNNQILNNSKVSNFYVQPASSDAGISIGAAWISSKKHGIPPVPARNTYLGNKYSNFEIEEYLKEIKIPFRYINNPEIEAANLIAKGLVIGWFQDRMEFGPRALGNRSILANPTIKGMNNEVNRKIKFRESFRPLCPSILEEDVSLYFNGKSLISPYMTVVYEINSNDVINLIPAVIHVDKTARIQTVNISENYLFYSLLIELKRLTGHGVVLNTSFNLANEPIVCTPKDAVATFYSSGMDALIIGNYLLKK